MWHEILAWPCLARLAALWMAHSGTLSRSSRSMMCVCGVDVCLCPHGRVPVLQVVHS